MPPTYQDERQPTRDQWLQKQTNEQAKAIITPHLPAGKKEHKQ